MVPQHDPDGGGHVRHRVVLGATCYADAEGGLTVAIELARHAGAELHGLLVQDEASLSAVRVMRARVLSFSGEPAAEVSEQALLSAYRADARRFAERLRGAARMARLRAEFRAVEGRLWDVVQQAADIGAFKALARRLNAELWLSARTHRSATGAHPTKIPEPCCGFESLIDVAVFLEPQDPSPKPATEGSP